MTAKRATPGRPPKDSSESGTTDAGKKHRKAKSAKSTVGFVPLTSLAEGPPDPAAAFDRIRTIYFSTTKRTIDADLAHAIELLKSLPTEEAREKATVYMEGLAQMRREWARKNRP